MSPASIAADRPAGAPAGDFERMPGHWVLARIGKRVLRPGGRAMTRTMLEKLEFGSDDDVVELAPGLGATAKRALDRHPRSWIGIERDALAARGVARRLRGRPAKVVVGSAEATGLRDGVASVVYGEAFLTMQTAESKARILREIARVLEVGGRYGFHEMVIVPDDLDEAAVAAQRRDLSSSIRVGARPLTTSGWRALLEEVGLEVRFEATAPMRLLDVGQIRRDEGLWGMARIGFNLIRRPDARRRVAAMRATFRSHRAHLAALCLVAVKTGA